MMQRTLIIGDIHGQLPKLLTLLREAAVIDEQQQWSGQETHLWFLGDFFDRGPDGLAVIELVMRLQRQAEQFGGSVQALLGNHEVALLAAWYLGGQMCGGPGGSFYRAWKYNGGQEQDLLSLTEEHLAWITTLPALGRAGDYLLMHADSTFYLDYGKCIEQVNAAITTMLSVPDARDWDHFLARCRRFAFMDHEPEGIERAQTMLQTFGGTTIVHGHTPISEMVRQPAETIEEAYCYAHGLCVNVDGGMYLGGKGFVFEHIE